MKRWLILIALVALNVAILAAAPVRPNRDKPQEENAAPRVILETNFGKVVIQLHADKAPISVQNFLQYVDDKHYDGTIFHRVIPNFMVQGGGFVPGMTEKKTRAPIKNEAANGLSNERGTIAMARTQVSDSATAQFYINLVDNRQLDADDAADKLGYCVFGKVVSGMDVVDRMARAATGQQGVHMNLPTQDIVIRSARRLAK